MSAHRRLPPITWRQLRDQTRRLAAELRGRDETIADRDREIRMLKAELANRDEQVAVLEQLAVKESHRADEADIAYGCLLETVQRQAEAEVNAITVPAARDRSRPAGDPTVETNVLALWEKPDAIARPYAPWPKVELKRTEPIAWRPGSPGPANIPGWAQPPQPASEADTQRLPTADSQRTGETPVASGVGT